jgi:hypothetical protein
VPGVLHRPHEGLEHEVEEAGLSQLAFVVLPRSLRRLPAAGLVPQLVFPEALLADLALHQRVGEPLHVSRGLPHLRMHEDGRVQPLHVVPLVHHPAPPPLLHVPLELDAQGPVVPDRAGPPVDLGGLEDVAAPLGQRHQLLHHVVFRHGRSGLGAVRIIGGGKGQPEARPDAGSTCPTGPEEERRRTRMGNRSGFERAGAGGCLRPGAHRTAGPGAGDWSFRPTRCFRV